MKINIVLYIAFFWSLLLFSSVYSQDDSSHALWEQLKEEKGNFERYSLLRQLLKEDRQRMQELSLEQQIKFYQEGIAMAIAVDSLHNAGDWALQLYEIFVNRENDFEKGLALMLESKKIAEKVPSTRLGGNLYLKLAAAYYNLGQFDDAIEFYSVAKNRFGENDSIFVADALFFRGQAKDYRGMFLSSLEDYELARKYYEQLGDQEFVDYVLNGISILFSKYGLVEEAEKIRVQLLQKLNKDEQFYDWCILMYNRSNDYRKVGNTEMQFQLLKEIEANFPEEDVDPTLQALIYFQFANYYAFQKNLAQQSHYFNLGESIVLVNNLSGSFTELSMAKARLIEALERRDKDKALKLAENFKELVKSTDNYDYKLEGLELYAKALKLNDRPEQALNAFERYHVFKDSVFAVNQANSFAYYQTLFETERKERELLSKTIEIDTITRENASKIRILVITASVIIVGLFLLYLINRLSSLKKTQQLQAQFAQDLLIYQEEERKRISKDLHDGLGQSLLLIKNKVALTSDDSTSSLLGSAIEELRGISRSLHPFQLEELGLTRAIAYLIDQIDESHDVFIDKSIEDVDAYFKREASLHVYRIVQEVFNNILKHSQAEGVRFTLKKRTNYILMTIEDNGVGFDFSEKFNDFKSLGLKTLKERSAALSGSIKVESEKNKGTKFIFQFPIS
ncbi:ATP-binding protein [Mongoliitalea daihaiensis]|uniref:ATP-binding protein n=1 Tax=Mongoliitalea daihaiensis TaxID=2782006 RepID=UPI001F44F9EC|nr:ATP-binding protein [Mongoliitalea daihaiensis]UJP65630.1 tetratricopeptide repeat protein [Mongoliitalea daihaiensis]